jgi:hypothetical protein
VVVGAWGPGCGLVVAVMCGRVGGHCCLGDDVRPKK